jgi:hypothetical protein
MVPPPRTPLTSVFHFDSGSLEKFRLSIACQCQQQTAVANDDKHSSLCPASIELNSVLLLAVQTRLNSQQLAGEDGDQDMHTETNLCANMLGLIQTLSNQLAAGRGLFAKRKILDRCGNDPSAGSPTETLLRLHLPLNDKV